MFSLLMMGYSPNINFLVSAKNFGPNAGEFFRSAEYTYTTFGKNTPAIYHKAYQG
jgi:hypothetical protein